MALIKDHWLVCDSCDDASREGGWGNLTTVKEARVDAIERGWHRSKGRDLCGQCWDRGTR